MKEVKNYLILIGAFFVCVFIYDYTHKSEAIDLKGYEKVITLYDTVYQQKTFTKYIKGDTIHYVAIDSVQNYVHDTVYIISDYNRIYAYSDTINQDSNIFVIDDTISQNRIKSRSLKAKISEKTITVREFYAEKPKNSLFWGIRGDFSQDNGLEVISPGLMLNAKNKALIGLNLDLYKKGGFGYSGGFYLKIGK